MLYESSFSALEVSKTACALWSALCFLTKYRSLVCLQHHIQPILTAKSLFYSLTVVIMITDVRIHSSRWYPPPSWSVWLSNEGIDWLKCSIMRTKARGDWLRHSCACDFILLLISCMSFVCGFIFFVAPTVWPRSLDAFENYYPLGSLVFKYVFGKLLFEKSA